MSIPVARGRSPFSQKHFLCVCCIIVGAIIAFPVYQAIVTKGFVFYTNGIDEAAYLSYPYAVILQTWRGLLRCSTTMVIALHEYGLSGGSINVLFDIIGSMTLLAALPFGLRHLGVSTEDSRRGALIVFLCPLLVTPFLPVVSVLHQARLSSSWFSWTALAPNADLLFVRTPEPQLSWMLIALVCAAGGRSRYLPWTLLACTPFVYSFVRAPLLFCLLVFIFPRQIPLWFRLVVSYAVTAILIKVFVDYSVDPSLHRFFVSSRLPVIPLSGVVSLLIYAIGQRFAPRDSKPLLVTLLVSTWVGPNLQVLSGWMSAPTKYEEYWSAVVISLLLALMIIGASKRPNVWLGLLISLFILWIVGNFRLNKAIFARLKNPDETIRVLRQHPERVASSDSVVSSYLDMVFPRQSNTLFSFTKTYDLFSNRNYMDYLCGRRFIRALPADISGAFEREFEALDFGYTYRGVDDVITMRRIAPDLVQFPSLMEGGECQGPDPILMPMK